MNVQKFQDLPTYMEANQMNMYRMSTLYMTYELTIVGLPPGADAKEVVISLWFRGRNWASDNNLGCYGLTAPGRCNPGTYGPCHGGSDGKDCVQRGAGQK